MEMFAFNINLWIFYFQQQLCIANIHDQISHNKKSHIDMAKEASLIVSSFKISSILLRLRKRKPSRPCLCFFVMKLPIKSVKLVVKLVVWTSSELPSSNLIEIDY